jgi:hypothetical protein
LGNGRQLFLETDRIGSIIGRGDRLPIADVEIAKKRVDER